MLTPGRMRWHALAPSRRGRRPRRPATPPLCKGRCHPACHARRMTEGLCVLTQGMMPTSWRFHPLRKNQEIAFRLSPGSSFLLLYCLTPILRTQGRHIDPCSFRNNKDPLLCLSPSYMEALCHIPQTPAQLRVFLQEPPIRHHIRNEILILYFRENDLFHDLIRPLPFQQMRLLQIVDRSWPHDKKRITAHSIPRSLLLYM